MCNLYSLRRSREEVIGLFDISRVGSDVQLDLPASIGDFEARAAKTDDKGKASGDECFVFERQCEWI
jgi:hypothetical protein